MQIVFIQDLPRRTGVETVPEHQFRSALTRLLNALGVFHGAKPILTDDDALIAYDWEAVVARLVYSLPGYHDTNAVDCSGMMMLNRYSKQLIGNSLVDEIEYQVCGEKEMNCLMTDPPSL